MENKGGKGGGGGGGVGQPTSLEGIFCSYIYTIREESTQITTFL